MIEIGSATAISLFRARHAAFFEGSAVLERALSLAFERAFETTDPAGTVIFFLGSRCADDFRELLVLAANGHGWGATAHVRGMFERCITAAYLHENPSAATDFIAYDYIQRWKLAQTMEGVLPLSPEQKRAREELKQDAESVKDRFLVTKCAACGTKRLNNTWSKLDLVSMSRRIKKMQLGRMLGPAYYSPLAQAHSTWASIIQRTGQLSEDLFAVDRRLAREEADRSFQLAHLLVINALLVQHEHFQLPELKQPIDDALAHFRHVWSVGGPSGGLPAGS